VFEKKSGEERGGSEKQNKKLIEAIRANHYSPGLQKLKKTQKESEKENANKEPGVSCQGLKGGKKKVEMR